MLQNYVLNASLYSCWLRFTKEEQTLYPGKPKKGKLPQKNGQKSKRLNSSKLTILVSSCWGNFSYTKMHTTFSFCPCCLEIIDRKCCILSGPPCINVVYRGCDHFVHGDRFSICFIHGGPIKTERNNVHNYVDAIRYISGLGILSREKRYHDQRS